MKAMKIAYLDGKPYEKKTGHLLEFGIMYEVVPSGGVGQYTTALIKTEEGYLIELPVASVLKIIDDDGVEK